MDLAVHDHRVDDVSAVVDRHILLNVHRSGFGVDLDNADVRAERPREVGWVEVGYGLKAVLHALREARSISRERDLPHSLALVRAALDVELTRVEDNVFVRSPEHMRGYFLGLLDHLLARSVDRNSTDWQAAAAVSPVAERSVGGVAMTDLDVRVREAERIGRNLRERGVVALAV